MIGRNQLPGAFWTVKPNNTVVELKNTVSSKTVELVIVNKIQGTITGMERKRLVYPFDSITGVRINTPPAFFD